MDFDIDYQLKAFTKVCCMYLIIITIVSSTFLIQPFLKKKIIDRVRKWKSKLLTDTAFEIASGRKIWNTKLCIFIFLLTWHVITGTAGFFLQCETMFNIQRTNQYVCFGHTRSQKPSAEVLVTQKVLMSHCHPTHDLIKSHDPPTHTFAPPTQPTWSTWCQSLLSLGESQAIGPRGQPWSLLNHCSVPSTSIMRAELRIIINLF